MSRRSRPPLSALARRGAREWTEQLNAVGIACGPLNNFAAVVSDPQVVYRRMFREMPDPACGTLTFVANPIRLSETPPEYVRPPPTLGEHSAEVLQEWLAMGDAGLAAVAAETGG